MEEETQVAVFNREVLHTSLHAPCVVVASTTVDAIVAVDASNLIYTFNICVEVWRESIVEVGYCREIFHVLGCAHRGCEVEVRLIGNIVLRVSAYDAFGVDALTGVHHVEIGKHRTTLEDVSGCEI